MMDEELTVEERRIIGWLKRQIAEAEQLQELMARRKEWGEAHHHKVKALAWGLAIDAVRRREQAQLVLDGARATYMREAGR